MSAALSCRVCGHDVPEDLLAATSTATGQVSHICRPGLAETGDRRPCFTQTIRDRMTETIALAVPGFAHGSASGADPDGRVVA